MIANNDRDERRIYGRHLTSTEIFKKYILSKIKDVLFEYTWIDLYAGEGNLILPILEEIPINNRVEFFKDHIFLFDINEKMVKMCIENAVEYGIPKEIAEKNIILQDTLENYPIFIRDLKYPPYHITNPPYLYVGYISKNEEAKKHLKYFKNLNVGYQDLYQVALINDLRNSIEEMIYIIPSNFLFGFSVSNKIRKDFLKYYDINHAIIFEKQIFEFTGTNVIICFFERKNRPAHEKIIFEGIKINKHIEKRKYVLEPQNNYRAGGEFENFIEKFKFKKPLKIQYYLMKEDVEKNNGDKKINVIDVNEYIGGKYTEKTIYVNDELYNKIKSNILFVKTVDTGSEEGRVGLFVINNIFDVDGILVSKDRYRTYPIQIFFENEISKEDQILLKDYFNFVLEHFREKTDSEFMTTYKYSNSKYTRKYMGLSQAKKIIKTFPILDEEKKKYLKECIKKGDFENMLLILKDKNKIQGLNRWVHP